MACSGTTPPNGSACPIWRARARAQVDVTADDAVAPGGLPAVKPEVLKQTAQQPMHSVLGMAQRQMGAAQWAAADPWVSVRAGVATCKPHKAQASPKTLSQMTLPTVAKRGSPCGRASPRASPTRPRQDPGTLTLLTLFPLYRNVCFCQELVPGVAALLAVPNMLRVGLSYRRRRGARLRTASARRGGWR